MKVMMYLGKATPKVVNNLKSMSDDIDYVVYTSVTNFVQDAETRHLSFSRVVFNNKFVPLGEEDFIRLNEFIRSFSSATELVMVINNGDTESEALFNKYFSSPLHTCVIVKGATSMDFFRDIASAPIADVKARYYTLDKSESVTITARSVESKIGSLRGGAKKSTETSESSQGDTKASEPVSKGGVEEKKSAEDGSAKNISETQSTAGDFASVMSTPNEDSEKESVFEHESSAPLEPTGSTVEDFMEDDEEDLLSVGSFGSAHSDTDMFDEDEEPGEIIDEPSVISADPEVQARRAAIEEQNRIAEEIQRAEKGKAKSSTTEHQEGNITLEPKHPVRKWPNLSGSVYCAYKINIITGVSGSGSAQQIVDDAVRMMESGMRVLIVDMDFVNNCILSFINTKNFYNGNHNGYTDGRVFVEEQIGVLSGGYGYTPSYAEVVSALSKGAKRYDIVLVDCPASSLKYLPDYILEYSNIIVFSGSDPSQIVATSLALTDRGNCSLKQERTIMSSCKHILYGRDSGLVSDTLSSLMFANGCWLK